MSKVEAGWRAELDLRFSRHHDPQDAAHPAGSTLLAHRRHTGPLVVQRPFYPEGRAVPHVYLLHPPGGLVGGDRLRLDVTADAGAHALITTPAATKVYRSAGGTACQQFRFTVGSEASVEWLPQETILHDGSYLDLATEVRLSPGARFIGMDTLCFGLSARGETYASGRCRQRWEIWRDDRPIFIERGRFDAADAVHAASWGLAGARVSGMMVMVPGVATQAQPLECVPSNVTEMMGRLRTAVVDVASPERAGVSVLGQGEAIVCRYLGRSAQGARTFFQRLWTLARPAVMGRKAVPPRIWAT